MRVHDSQAYRKLDVTRERISRMLELRETLLSIQTGFSLVSAAVVCAILERISGLKSQMIFKNFQRCCLCIIQFVVVLYYEIQGQL